MKKILMLVGDFVEDYEVMVPFQMLQMLGHTVHAVCPAKSTGHNVKTAIHDFEGDQTYTEKQGHNFELNADFETVNPAEYDGLIVPGGRSSEYIRLDKKVLEIVRHFMQENKPVAAICHGPMVLAAADVLEGRTLTGYTTLQPDVLLAGGTWVDVDETFANVCVDENLVSTPTWLGHPGCMREFVELLGTKIEL